MTGILTAAETAFWREQGYLAPFTALSTEQALARRTKLEDWEARTQKHPTRSASLKAHLIFTWLYDVATSPAILDRVESLIGPNILIYSSTIWLKDVDDGTFVSWHQDSGYLGIDPPDGLQAWVALADATSSNGCLRISPGSHKSPDLVHEETFNPKNLVSRGQVLHDIDESKAVDLELKAGQFSLHHERTVHGSGYNNGPDRRIGYSVLYMPTYSRCTLSRRGALLARGEDTYGHWDLESPPTSDEDPEVFAYLDRAWAGFKKRDIPQAPLRAAGD